MTEILKDLEVINYRAVNTGNGIRPKLRLKFEPQSVRPEFQ